MRPLPALALLVLLACGEEKKPVVKPTPVKKSVAKPAEEGPWFVDVAEKLGIFELNRTGEPGKKKFIVGGVGPGAAILDADGDGRLDVYIPNGNRLKPPFYLSLDTAEDRPRNALYMQQPDGTFVNEAKKRGVDCDRWGFGTSAVDIDNDGDQDLLVANFTANRLYLNDGKGHFTDVAPEAGLAGRDNDWTTGFGVGDVNRDGWPDVYVSNYGGMFEWIRNSPNVKRDAKGHVTDASCLWQKLRVYCGPKGLPAQQDYLLLGTGVTDGVPRFEDVSKKSGIYRPGRLYTREGPGFGFQVLVADMNHDMWPDIFVANDTTSSFYFESNKDGTFRECAEERGIAFSDMGTELAGMGADLGDINRDGHFDMIKTNFALQTFNLYVADWFKGRMDWREWSMRTGMDKEVWTALGWGALMFDFDHDGDLDIFFANGHVFPEVDQVPSLNMSFKQYNQLFRNMLSETGKLAVKHISQQAGPAFATKEASRGASLVDIDDDGDEDIVVVNLNGRPNVYLNTRGNKQGRWLQLRLFGNPAKKSTRDAIHSLIKVECAVGTQYFQVLRGRGFIGTCDPRVQVGLGKSPGKVKIEITWPNGDVETMETEEVDRVIRIDQR
ncbi:MAG: CRTAC1 family protein [Planctomycetota bacterium]|jgi:hypothetical protein